MENALEGDQIKNQKTKFSKRRRKDKKANVKRARLVVKNISFKATEESIRSYFSQYGDVSSVNLLKSSDGRLVGCAFVQYTTMQFARKAIHYTNNQMFLGRTITVELAKPKQKYTVNQKPEDSSLTQNAEEKFTPKDDPSLVEDSDSADSDEEPPPKSFKSDNKETFTRPVRVSNDAGEGKTVFIKNVPFQATNDDVRETMMQFGPLDYAVVCVDKLTGYSKGTAFVKFMHKEDAEKALKAGTELTLMDNILDCTLALCRGELQEKLQLKKENKPRDSRNLYLVKEGVILAGSKAAENVSLSDMTKRINIEEYKTQKLRNLNTYVSRERLIVYNLPKTWDDNKLKLLFEKHGGPGAHVKEARIMRDNIKIDANGVGESKEYGFVGFTSHENALAALRSINNNPNIFSPQKRPIVTFSIENKSAINAKLARQNKSKQNKGSFTKQPIESKKPSKLTEDGPLNSFSGVIAKEGQFRKSKNKYKPEMQTKIHRETLKKEKQRFKNKVNKKMERNKLPKQKINSKTSEDNFSKILNNYKKIISKRTEVGKKSRWCE